MPLQATSGAASYDAFGGGVPVVPNYIEDVFSTYLYTGNATTGQSINNGIDLATKGGLLWCKNRTTGSTPHYLFDTARDFSYSHATVLNTASTAAQEDKGTDYAKPETNGFSFGSGAGSTSPNKSGDAFASWTFRKQPKFFDVITWTGNGAATQTISHNLGSAPGCIIAKVTSTTGNWFVYHRGTSGTPLQDYLRLNLTNAANASGSDLWGATSTTITVDSGLNLTTNGATYVAYVFAHDAGGFGLTGTDNVISCGSCVSDASGYIQPVNLGYEPQWVMLKRTNSAANWVMMDTMRGMANTAAAASPILLANTSAAEAATGVQVNPTATGFEDLNWGGWGASNTYIYIAIRRGPMKVPTSGTSVFAVNSLNTPPFPSWVSGFPVDMAIMRYNANTTDDPQVATRLLQQTQLLTSSTAVETSNPLHTFDYNNGWGSRSGVVSNWYSWMYRRAPGFFDEVCYLGTGVATTVAHNLGAVPELMIVKERNGANGWQVYSASLTNTDYLILNTSAAVPSPSTTRWNSTTPTSTVFSVGTHGATNGSGQNFVAYLFASCPGVSKVGSYTGTGTTLQIDCGFTGGARFVLIKRTDSTGDWYVWDTARGIVSGNDPYLLLNSTAAEVTNTDYIDTYSAGFEISSTAPAAINASGGSFMFLAIA